MITMKVNECTETGKSPYNPEYVANIKESAKDKTGKEVTAETLWQDLGL